MTFKHVNRNHADSLGIEAFDHGSWDAYWQSKEENPDCVMLDGIAWDQERDVWMAVWGEPYPDRFDMKYKVRGYIHTASLQWFCDNFTPIGDLWIMDKIKVGTNTASSQKSYEERRAEAGKKQFDKVMSIIASLSDDEILYSIREDDKTYKKNGSVENSLEVFEKRFLEEKDRYGINHTELVAKVPGLGRICFRLEI